MDFFAQNDYKKLFLTWLQQQPKRGRGLLASLAQYLDVHSTLVSLIFKGHSHLTTEQSILTAQFMNLNSLEAEYFCQLVQLERVAKPAARKYVEERLKEIRAQSDDLKKITSSSSDLQDADYATFFSHWLYTWMFLKVATEPGVAKSAFLATIDVDVTLKENVLQFLLTKRVLQEKDHHLFLGSQQIYVGKESLFLRNHLMNWRQKSIETLRDTYNEDDLYFSSPVALSIHDKRRITQKIQQLLKEFAVIADPSESEIVCCLNVDWFTT